MGTNRDAYIPPSLNFEVSEDKQRLVLNPCVEDLNTRDISLASVGKAAKKKISKSKLDILSSIKAWSGLANSKDRIKRLNCQLKLFDALAEVRSMDQSQNSEKNGN